MTEMRNAGNAVRRIGMRNFVRGVLCCGLSIFAALICCVVISAQTQTQPARKKNAPPPDAPVSAEEAAQIEAVITTDLGVIRFEFLADKAPKHVQQFIKLARSGFYD